MLVAHVTFNLFFFSYDSCIIRTIHRRFGIFFSLCSCCCFYFLVFFGFYAIHARHAVCLPHTHTHNHTRALAELCVSIILFVYKFVLFFLGRSFVVVRLSSSVLFCWPLCHRIVGKMGCAM